MAEDPRSPTRWTDWTQELTGLYSRRETREELYEKSPFWKLCLLAIFLGWVVTLLFAAASLVAQVPAVWQLGLGIAIVIRIHYGRRYTKYLGCSSWFSILSIFGPFGWFALRLLPDYSRSLDQPDTEDLSDSPATKE